jgi:hypothetical protein
VVSAERLLRAQCRRILLFPFGNSNAPPNDTVSVYLDYAEPKKSPEGWHACAQFALVISNIHDPTIYTVSRTFGNSRNVTIPHFPEPQTPIIALSQRSVIGALLVLASCASYLMFKKGTTDQLSRMIPPKSPSTYVYWKTQLAFYGTTLSSLSIALCPLCLALTRL